MRLLYISNLYPPAVGGSQIHLHKLAKATSAVGHSPSVITLTSRCRTDWLGLSTYSCDGAKRYEYEGIPVWQIGFPRAVRLRLFPWALSYYAFMEATVQAVSAYMLPYFERLSPAPNIVHVTRNGREFLARAALEYAHCHDIPLVLTPNHHPRWRGWMYREYDKIYRKADAVFALTDAERETLVNEKRVREERVHVTGIGPVLADTFDPDEFRSRFNIQGRFVLWLGQQLRYKGVGALLRAASSVLREHVDVNFVFIGPRSSYSDSLFAGNDDHRIRNLGEVDLRTKTSALAACEFLCVPSSQESFGGVYVEAWSLRRAVIGGRIPPIASVISDGTDGLLSSRDPGELAEMISYLLSNPGKCEEMGNAGWLKVQKKYTWARIASQTLKVYEKLAGVHPTSSSYETEALPT